MCAHVHVCACACTHACAHALLFARVRMHACVRACVCVCACACARVCGRTRAHVIAASAPPQRSTDNRHWAVVRCAMCWVPSRTGRDVDQTGAPKNPMPGSIGGHHWGAKPCRTFIQVAPENQPWQYPSTFAHRSSCLWLSARPNNTCRHEATALWRLALAKVTALTQHPLTAFSKAKPRC